MDPRPLRSDLSACAARLAQGTPSAPSRGRETRGLVYEVLRFTSTTGKCCVCEQTPRTEV